MGFIYMWENKLDGKKYLGKCQGKPSSSYIGSGKHFKRAIKKYGIENFERIIIEHCDDPKKLIEREKHWLDFYNAAENPMFYNISPNSGGGHHGANYKGNKNPMWGKKHPNHKPHKGNENGMYGVHRYGAENPNAKPVIIIDNNNNIYEGACLKDVCNLIFGNVEYYDRMKHMVRLCMKGSKPARNSIFYGWTGKYKE
jgi:hypothetical protein